MNIEAAAEAIFTTFHTRFGRTRRWAAHPDDDTTEPGRDAFREMARGVAAMPEERVDEPAPPPEATIPMIAEPPVTPA